jgi:inorganic triphosphatase YgiF
MEVEAKFSVPDRATFERLSRLKELAGYRLEPAGVKQIRDRYLDTDDRAILRAGYACRVRTRGQEHVATLKGLGGAEAGGAIHHRVEHEVAVGGSDPATWPESSVRELTLEFSAGQPLHELVSLGQERHLRLLCADVPGGVRQVAELSLDVVTPGLPNSHPYFELEIELLEQGSEADLHLLAQELRQTWGLRPEPRSKFERGLELLGALSHSDQGRD